MTWDNSVPFTENGSLLTYVYPYQNDIVWKPNFTFEETLHLHRMTRGRSAARLVWKDKKDREYQMFLTDLADLIRSEAVIQAGECRYAWTFVKRGQNYGIRPAK